MIYETQEQLNEALALWQKRLRLNDWQMSAEFSCPRDMNGCRGDIATWGELAEAHIRITRQDSNSNFDTGRPFDHEQILVHELIHGHFEGIAPSREDSVRYMLWERGIEQMAKAITDAYREVK